MPDLHQKRLLKWIRACKATLRKEPADSARVPHERRLLAALEGLLAGYRIGGPEPETSVTHPALLKQFPWLDKERK